jgi:hypothetical protein
LVADAQHLLRPARAIDSIYTLLIIIELFGSNIGRICYLQFATYVREHEPQHFVVRTALGVAALLIVFWLLSL